MNRRIEFSLLLAAALAAGSLAAVTMGPGAHYASDAYPGFDDESGILEKPRKETGFWWWCGPKKGSPAEQFAWARELEDAGKHGKARGAYDDLVAEWPNSPEAPLAQRRLADIAYGDERDYIDAFDEYKYLLDFYPSQCDYDAVARRLYDAACAMRREGKRVAFFRFANNVDVRRAFESVVLHAPGAEFAPAAMLAVAELREKSGDPDEAIQVYETLRSRYAKSPEAETALVSEARVRMDLLRRRGYNRARCLDTVGYLKMARGSERDPKVRAEFDGWIAEVEALVEDEAFAAAKFYDSKTRTRHGAVSAYEKFLREFPASRHADEARARLEELAAGRGEVSK